MDVVSETEWAQALWELRAEEKQATRARDALAAKAAPATGGGELFGLSVWRTAGGAATTNTRGAD